MLSLTIDKSFVGANHPCFVIAEAGVNHNGNVEMAFRLVDAAVAAGADAIKFQTFKAEHLVTVCAPKAAYQQRTSGADETQFQMLQRLELSAADHRALIAYCARQGILFISTPFDEESADLLDELGLPAFKIPSGEVTNLPFLAHIARKGKPIILSTGMASLSEVEAAVETIEAAGNHQLVLLHCVSNYPADPADVNLRAMQTLASAFKTIVGYSDHTLGNEVCLAAVAMGASVIEKHMTLDRTLPGPDHAASAEPDEFASLVRGIRTVEAAQGDGRKRPALSEQNTAAVARKSLVAVRDLAAGSHLTEDMIAIKRPGTGLQPIFRPYLLGKTLKVDVPAGALFSLEMVS